MTTTKVESNYPEFNAGSLPSSKRVITLRSSPYQYDNPLSWDQFDNNFELLRYSLNSLVDDIEAVGTKTDSDITNLSTRVNSLESLNTDSRLLSLEAINMTSIQSDIASAKSDITSIESDITSIESDVTSIQSDVTSLQSDVSSNTSSITLIQSDISSNTSSITLIQSDVSSNTSDITSLQSDVSGNTSSISTLQGRVSSLESGSIDASVESDITSLQSSVSTLQSDTNLLDGRVSSLESGSIDASVESDITSLQSSVSTLQSDTNLLDGRVSSLESSSIDLGISDLGESTLSDTLSKLTGGDSVTISSNADFIFTSNAEAILQNTPEGEMVFDFSRNALRVYDFNPSIPSVSSDDRHTLQLQRHTDRGAFGSASSPVGVSGQVNCALNAKSIVGPNVKSNEWAILGVVENFPNKNNSFAHAESEHVGGYFQGKRHGSGGKTWGATIEAWDLANTYADVQFGSCVTVELDMTANFDAGANRVIVDGVLRKTNEELDRPGVIAGMRLRDNHEDGSGGFFYNAYEFKGAAKISAFSAEIVGDNSDDGVTPWGNSAYRALGTTYAHFQSQGTPTFAFRDVSNAAVGIGLNEATYSNCAIRLGVNQRVVMDGTGGVSFKYNGTSISFEGAPVETTYMRPSNDSSNPFEVYVDNGWKKVELGPADSAGSGYRSIRVAN
jgi:predicted  nucleic acid-binding Zn-ribbon protein